MVDEVALDRQWQFLDELRQAGEQGNIGIPQARPEDELVKTLMMNALKSNKGNGHVARLIESLESSELPASIRTFLSKVYDDFPKPPPVPHPAAVGTTTEQGSPEAADGQQETRDHE